MPFNGSGTFVPLAPPNFPAVPFTTILASQTNANLNDIFTNGLTKCLTRDGQSTPTANLPMAGFRFTGIGNGISDTDSAALGQTLALRGAIGATDWDARTTTGILEATAASLTGPATNFPPTSNIGQLVVLAQGATVNQIYSTANAFYTRQKVSGVWSLWFASTVTRDNSVVNSAFTVWQAGTSLGSGTGKRYLADCFFDNSTGTTYVPTQQSFALGQTDVDSRATFFKRTVVTSVANANNFCYLETPLENVRTLGGKTIAISFYAKTASSNPIAVSIEQNFGTTGSPSATVITPCGKITTTTSWARYSVSVAVPNVSGKTLGSDANDYLGVRLWFDAGATFNSETTTLGQQSGTFDIFGLKVEEGTFITPYAFPDFTLTIDQCMRFYYNETSWGAIASFSELTFSGNVTSGSAYIAIARFQVAMRANPSVTLADTGGGLNFSVATGTVGNVTKVSFSESRTAGANGVGRFSSTIIADARL